MSVPSSYTSFSVPWIIFNSFQLLFSVFIVLAKRLLIVTINVTIEINDSTSSNTLSIEPGAFLKRFLKIFRILLSALQAHRK